MGLEPLEFRAIMQAGVGSGGHAQLSGLFREPERKERTHVFKTFQNSLLLFICLFIAHPMGSTAVEKEITLQSPCSIDR